MNFIYDFSLIVMLAVVHSSVIDYFTHRAESCYAFCLSWDSLCPASAFVLAAQMIAYTGTLSIPLLIILILFFTFLQSKLLVTSITSHLDKHPSIKKSRRRGSRKNADADFAANRGIPTTASWGVEPVLFRRSQPSRGTLTGTAAAITTAK